jgi:hypothetical protein
MSAMPETTAPTPENVFSVVCDPKRTCKSDRSMLAFERVVDIEIRGHHFSF